MVHGQKLGRPEQLFLQPPKASAVFHLLTSSGAEWSILLSSYTEYKNYILTETHIIVFVHDSAKSNTLQLPYRGGGGMG